MDSRRNFLRQGFLFSTAAFMSDALGYSAGYSSRSNDKEVKELAEQFGKQTNIKVLTKAEAVQVFASDFGNIYKSVPEAVFQPQSVTELQEIVRFLQKEKIPMVVRGEGHSQSGQSLTVANGVTIDMKGMKKIIKLDKKNRTLTCEAGCTWREVVEYGKPERMMPPVMPLFVDLSIGGTISSGGLGSTCFRYGISASNVEEMQVVLPNGELIHCTRTHNAEIFQAVLSNTGHIGIIYTVGLKVREYKPGIITYYLLYDNLDQWLQDQQTLSDSSCEHIQGFFTSSMQGLKYGRPFLLWFYGLQVSFEFADEAEKKLSADVVAKLKPYRRTGEEIADTAAFSHRFDPRFQAMRQSGAFALPHPWMEFLLPFEKLEMMLPVLLEKLPLSMGDGHRLLFINNKDLPDNFRTPDASSIAVFAALPSGIPQQQLPEVLPKLKEVHDFVIANGGKRYLSGWLGMMQASDWEQHWGTTFTDWRKQKDKLDPGNIFQSRLFAETFKNK